MLYLEALAEVGFLMKCVDQLVWECGNLLGRSGRITFIISDLWWAVELGSESGLMFGAVVFPSLFRIVLHKEDSVADYMDSSNGLLKWNVSFIRSV